MGIEFSYFQPLYGAQYTFIYLLTAVLFLLTVISFIRNKFDVLNPSFIYCICLTGCCSLDAMCTNEWNLPMHFNSAFIIIMMSVLFLAGSSLAEVSISKKKYISRIKESSQGFFISWPVWGFFVILLIYAVYLNYNDFITLASQVTHETELKNMLGPVVKGLAHQKIEMNRWTEYRLRFAMGLAYISVLAVWLNLMANQYKEILKWICFIVLYIPFMVLTGGRQQFMYLVIFSMISFFFIYRRHQKNTNSLRKEFAIIGVAVCAFLICFLGIGIINGKIGTEDSFVKVLVHYAGTNISAFDVYINEMTIPDTPYIGVTTLIPIYGFLHAHSFSVPQFSQYITLFTAFGPVTTNVYTAFYRYINDYGYLGCALIMFLVGFFYTYFYRQIYCYGKKNWMILVYASIVYPIFLMGREERFFNEILTTGKISFIIGLLILYKFFEFLNEQRSKAK